MQCWAPRLLLNLLAFESHPPTNTALTLYGEVELLVLDTKTIASVPQNCKKEVNWSGDGGSESDRSVGAPGKKRIRFSSRPRGPASPLAVVQCL